MVPRPNISRKAFVPLWRQLISWVLILMQIIMKYGHNFIVLSKQTRFHLSKDRISMRKSPFRFTRSHCTFRSGYNIGPHQKCLRGYPALKPKLSITGSYQYISNNMVHGCIWGILNPLCFRVLYTPVTNGIILEAVIVLRLIHRCQSGGPILKGLTIWPSPNHGTCHLDHCCWKQPISRIGS